MNAVQARGARMEMSKAQKLMTAEELYHVPSELPGIGSRFYELDHGVLLIREPGGYYHGNLGLKLSTRLAVYVEDQRLGETVGSDVGFVLRRDPDTVLSPDCAFIRNDRVPVGAEAHLFFEGAPDLAVEVISPSDKLVDVNKKARKYLEAGTRIVWVVNGRNKTVVVHRSNAIPKTLIIGDVLDGEDVVPGFNIPVAGIFHGS